MNSLRHQLHAVFGSETEIREADPMKVAGAIETGDGPGPAPRSQDGATMASSGADVPEPRAMLPRIRIDAFVESAPLHAAIECVARDRRAVRSDFAIRRGGFGAAMDLYRDYPAADLVMIEDSGSSDPLEWQIEALAEFCPPTTRLIVIGERNDIVLYRRLIKIGVSDYLVQPVTPLVLLDSIASIFMEEEDTKNLGLVVAFVGARGGVGSSTVAHNAAAILRRRFDATTLLIDADIGFGTAGLQFDVSSPRSLADVLKEGKDLDREMLERLTHWRDKRLGILIAPDRPDQMAAPDLGAMRHLVDQARLLAKYVVLDLPHGWAPWTAEALAAADRVVLVAAPDLPSLRNARTLLGLVQKMRPNDEPAQLVLNRMPVRGKPLVSKNDFSRVLDRKNILTLPCDDAAASAEMAGRVLAEDTPGSAIAGAIELLTAGLVGHEPTAKRKMARNSLIGRLFSRSGK